MLQRVVFKYQIERCGWFHPGYPIRVKGCHRVLRPGGQHEHALEALALRVHGARDVVKQERGVGKVRLRHPRANVNARLRSAAVRFRHGVQIFHLRLDSSRHFCRDGRIRATPGHVVEARCCSFFTLELGDPGSETVPERSALIIIITIIILNGCQYN